MEAGMYVSMYVCMYVGCTSVCNYVVCMYTDTSIFRQKGNRPVQLRELFSLGGWKRLRQTPLSRRWVSRRRGAKPTPTFAWVYAGEHLITSFSR